MRIIYTLFGFRYKVYYIVKLPKARRLAANFVNPFVKSYL